MSKGKYWKVKDAIKSPTILDIAWFSGILEGEGYFGKNITTHEVSITQKYPWILIKIQKLFGGALGKTYKQGSYKKMYWRWRASGARARGIMMTIFLFLSPHRKTQIKKALK